MGRCDLGGVLLLGGITGAHLGTESFPSLQVFVCNVSANECAEMSPGLQMLVCNVSATECAQLHCFMLKFASSQVNMS